jgi:hypothetical protein
MGNEQSASQAAQKLSHDLLCIGARLHRLLKKSNVERFASGHDFSRAEMPLCLSSPAALAASDLFFFPLQKFFSSLFS